MIALRLQLQITLILESRSMFDLNLLLICSLTLIFIRYPVKSVVCGSEQPIRIQGTLLSTNERTGKLRISKIRRSSSFCVKFQRAHCGYRDQAIRIIGFLNQSSQLNPFKEEFMDEWMKKVWLRMKQRLPQLILELFMSNRK